ESHHELRAVLPSALQDEVDRCSAAHTAAGRHALHDLGILRPLLHAVAVHLRRTRPHLLGLQQHALLPQRDAEQVGQRRVRVRVAGDHEVRRHGATVLTRAARGPLRGRSLAQSFSILANGRLTRRVRAPKSTVAACPSTATTLPSPWMSWETRSPHSYFSTTRSGSGRNGLLARTRRGDLREVVIASSMRLPSARWRGCVTNQARAPTRRTVVPHAPPTPRRDQIAWPS